MTRLILLRTGPLTTLQDAGRPGLLRHGISASGPMDRAAFARAGTWLGGAGSTGIEFTMAGLDAVVEQGPLGLAADGGAFRLAVNGREAAWPTRQLLNPGDVLAITPGGAGNYGYLRFDRDIAVPEVMGSRATNLVVGLGGYRGRALQAGDRLDFGEALPRGMSPHPRPAEPVGGPFRIVWGLHAERFPAPLRQRFLAEPFEISAALDRMGVRLKGPEGLFDGLRKLSLVSDAVVPGDIQILGDGTPIVLMRDHQPTGGYPRLATLVTADLDRFAQQRPGSQVRFTPVTVAQAQQLSGGRRP